MAQTKVKDVADALDIQQLLQSLDSRIARLEEYLGLEEEPEEAARAVADAPAAAEFEEESGIELKIGEFGLAWLGSLVLLLGIAFLMTYTYSQGYTVLSTLLGYLAAAASFLVSRKWQKSLPYLASLLAIVSHLLIFYTTLRLHFFTDQPVIESRFLAIFLLLLAAGVQYYVAIRGNSEVLAGIAALLLMATALLSDATHVCLPLIVVASAISVYLFIVCNWWKQVIATLFLAYLTHALWLFNNPVMGHPFQAVTEHQYSFLYLLAYAAIFSWPSLLTSRETLSASTVLAKTFLNGGAFSLLTLFTILAFFRDDFVGISLAAAGFFLVFSMLQWRRTHRPFEPAFYACFGFMALTAAVFSYTKIPAAYFWLSLQSLLVVSMALWYRSRLIVVVNTFIYVMILLLYLFTSASDNMVNLSFAITALASARIMNWQKERLTLRTEMLRNIYLIAAFFVVLYGLFQAVPNEYVTLSWTIAAVCYFGLSLLLSNIKYRWMAITTMIAAVLYLFFVDLARLEAGYRVLAFIFLGLILLSVSLFYGKFRQRLTEKEK